MKHGARIQTAIDILERILKSKIPMDNVIRDYMKARSFIGSKDRAAIVEFVYAIVRTHARVGWWMEKNSIADIPRLRMLTYLMLIERRSSQNIQDMFNGEKFNPDALTAQELDFITQIGTQDNILDQMPLSVRVECPEWALEKLQSLYQEDFEEELTAMLSSAPLDLRVNTLKSDIDSVKKSLEDQDVKTSKTLYSPYCLRVEGKTFMSSTKAFMRGMVEIQDEGSQLIALLCDAKPGMRVLDFCAGGGGKTLAIAASMENKGNVTAMDLSTKRLEKGRTRYRKAGVHNVEIRSLEEEQHRKWLRRQKGSMDVVLVDAPCSSSGTWRRNPDLRWSQYGPSLEEIKEMQRDILDRIADKVKPGGRLVYATCSLFKEENEDQINVFLEKYPDYTILPLEEAWQSSWGKAPESSPFLRLSPNVSGTDGFFAAVLTRKNS